MRPLHTPFSILLGIVAIVLLTTIATIPPVWGATFDTYSFAFVDTTTAMGGASPWLGQCFTAGFSGVPQSATFQLSRNNAPAGQFQYEIWTSTGSYGTTCSRGGTEVSESQPLILLGLPSDALTTTLTPITLNFVGGNAGHLTSGTVYALIIHPVTAARYDTGNYISMGTNTLGNSHAGNAITCSTGFTSSMSTSSCGGTNAFDIPFSVDGRQDGSGNVGQPQANCYGNCGATQNTESTSTLPFNDSITFFYQAQALETGSIRNVTTYVSQDFNTAYHLYLGLYIVDHDCTGSGSPFTSQCPGILVKSVDVTGPKRGINALYTNEPIKAGQVFGIAFSSNIQGIKINNTDTSQAFYRTGGRIPSVITSFVATGTSFTYLRASLLPSPTTGTSPNALGGACDAKCNLLDFVDGLGLGRAAGALVLMGGLYFGTVIGLSYATRQTGRTGNVYGYWFPSAGYSLLFILFVLVFSAAGVLPSWTTVLLMLAIAWMFTDMLLRKMGRR